MTTSAKQGADGRFLKGVSGNPKGRKPGIIDKRTRILQALAEDAQKIVDVVVSKALEGDMSAANIVLARIAPALKQQAERVQFTLDPQRPPSEQAEQVLIAMAEGLVDPETGKLIIDCLKSVVSIRSVEELEQRLIQLESKQIG
jgi:hypothetical protein